jgi:hypothetical protein
MISRALIATGLATSLVVLGGCGAETGGQPARATAAAARTDGSCDPFVGRIAESKEYTPFELQRSTLGDDTILLNPESRPSGDVPAAVALDEVAGLPIQWSIASGSEYYQYFSNSPITARTTVHDFRAGGGVSVEVTPLANLSLGDMEKQLGDRATQVPIDGGIGIVVWADPTDKSGLRLHHVYWEESEHLFGLLMDANAEEAVSTARQIACR